MARSVCAGYFPSSRTENFTDAPPGTRSRPFSNFPAVLLKLTAAFADPTNHTSPFVGPSSNSSVTPLSAALLTRYEYMSAPERAKQIEYLGRYGQDRIRKIAKRLKADLVRAA